MLRVSGSRTQTLRQPVSSQSDTFAKTSEARSFGESTSTARSGAPGKKPAGTDAGIRSALTKAASGARTVSGSRRIRNPAFGAEHPAELSLLNEVVKNPAERRGDNCLQRTGGRHEDNLPVQQFTTSQARFLEQLLGRRYFRNRCHDVHIIGVPTATVKKEFTLRPIPSDWRAGRFVIESRHG